MKLTDSQLIVLSAASRAAHLSVLPLPPKMKGAAGDTVIKALLARKLIAERPLDAGRDLPVHRADKRGKRFGLVLADAGLKALGAEPDTDTAVEPAAVDRAPRTSSRATTGSPSSGLAKPARQAKSATPAPKSKASLRNAAVAVPRDGSKLAKLIALLRRKDGATVDQIAKAFDWQRHTVRGAIAGALKKKLGLDVISEKSGDGARIYRITG